MNDMTVGGLMRRLQRWPEEALCCGTFWLADDFLALDETLTPEEIARAMDIATDRHDASVGFNWDHLAAAIEAVKGEE